MGMGMLCFHNYFIISLQAGIIATCLITVFLVLGQCWHMIGTWKVFMNEQVQSVDSFMYRLQEYGGLEAYYSQWGKRIHLYVL